MVFMIVFENLCVTFWLLYLIDWKLVDLMYFSFLQCKLWALKDSGASQIFYCFTDSFHQQVFALADPWYVIVISNSLKALFVFCIFFFSIWVFFQDHLWITELQGRRDGVYLTPLYLLHTLHRHLDISRAIIAGRSTLHWASTRA